MCTAFEYLILITIFANCVALAIVTPYPMADSNEVNAALVSPDHVYLVDLGFNQHRRAINTSLCVYDEYKEVRPVVKWK